MKTWVMLIVLMSLPAIACAAPQDVAKRTPMASFSTPAKPVTGRMVLRDSTADALATQTSGLLAARPDIRWRIAGEQARAEGRDEEARLRFRRAARYGDKQAQSILARMYHDGDGAVRDRALAFAWMAIAAERGDARYVQLRDRYWQQFDAAQRREAEARLRTLQAEYGDARAIPRLRRSIRGARHQATGSRLGYAGVLEVTTTNGHRDTSGTSMSGPDYYDEKYWRSPQPESNPPVATPAEAPTKE
jgi:hypothetical protein